MLGTILKEVHLATTSDLIYQSDGGYSIENGQASERSLSYLDWKFCPACQSPKTNSKPDNAFVLDQKDFMMYGPSSFQAVHLTYSAYS
jgi:hypothetical protein